MRLFALHRLPQPGASHSTSRNHGMLRSHRHGLLPTSLVPPVKVRQVSRLPCLAESGGARISLRSGGGRVDATGEWLVGAKGEYPLHRPYLLALLVRRALREVEPQRPAALVNRLRPRRGVDHVEAVEPDLAEAPFLDVIRHQRLAEAPGRVAAEVAGACEVAVAGLDVVDLQLPAGNLVPGLGRGLPLRLRHRASSTRATNTHPRARSSAPGTT